MKTKKSHFSASRRIDYSLAIVVAALIILGIWVLASVSAFFSQEKFGSTTYYLFHQITYGLVVGIILGFIAFKIRLEFFKKWAWVFILINLDFMALVFVPQLGIVTGGASRWLNFRFFSFQPSEFLKLTFILYLSAWLVSRTGKRSLKKNWKSTLFPFFIILVIIAILLIKQSDVSTLGVIIFVALLMYFSANTPFWHTILMFAITGGIRSWNVRSKIWVYSPNNVRFNFCNFR